VPPMCLRQLADGKRPVLDGAPTAGVMGEGSADAEMFTAG